MTDDGKPLPTKPFLELKLRDVDSVVNHRFTDAELQEKLRRSGALAQRTAPIERISINNRRRIAEDRGDEAAIAKCDAELAALNGPKLRYGTSLVDPKAQGPALPTQKSQQDRLAELNARNRKQNKEDVRKAQLAERKAERLSREAVQRGEAVQNPFARVKTYAKTHHDVNNKGLTPNQQITSRNVSRSGTPAATTPKPEETKPHYPSPPQKFTASGMPILSNRNMDDEIIAAMDLGIDIEI
jgi:RNA polymerase-associated protein RTF1